MAFFEMEYEYRAVSYDDARNITDFLTRVKILTEEVRNEHEANSIN